MNKEQLFVRVIGSLENCISEKSGSVSLKYLCVGGGGNDWDTPSSLFRRGLTGVTVNVNWEFCSMQKLRDDDTTADKATAQETAL